LSKVVFSGYSGFPHNKAEILLKVVLNTIYLTLNPLWANFQLWSFWVQIIFRWGDGDVRFVDNQHGQVKFYNAHSLKHNSPRVDMSLHSDIVLILNQPGRVFAPYCFVLSREAANNNFIVSFDQTRARTHDLLHSKQAH
jgi:hypothetical protein